MSKACWSCKNQMDIEDALCPACNALQPGIEKDAFAMLELNKSFDIEPAELEQTYFEKQRIYHPDRFAKRSKQEKIYAAQHSAALNEAFNTIKDPVHRGRLLLKLADHKTINIEQQSLQDPELLFEVMTLREQMVDAKDKNAIENVKARVKYHMVVGESSISKAFNENNFEEAAKQINRLSYFTKIYYELQQKEVL